ncbi:MAG: ferritin-like domain-containing protein [Chitinophagaceae bacterium]|nr:ferritin-like domain-containing protein [Anaerolineae bacterium]
MALENLRDLYIEQLRDIYSAETQLTEALPKMAKAASNTELRKGFEGHLKETQEHIKRLEQIFKGLDVKSSGKKCKGMEGLIKEGVEMIEEEGADAVKDAGLIAAAQRIEHYEIAAYGTVHAYAETLGEDAAGPLLMQTLDEEKATDHKLTQLAETHLNAEAQRS